MIIFIYGEDTFRVQEKTRHIIGAYLKKFDNSGLNLSEFKEGFDIGAVAESLLSPPFCAQKRMVVLRDVIGGSKKGASSGLISVLDKIPETSIAVFVDAISKDSLEKHEVFKRFKDKDEVHSYHFNELSESELNGWILSRSKEIGLNIDREVAQKFALHVGADLWRADTELKKLAAFADGEKVSAKQIEEMVEQTLPERIFDFVDALSKKNAAGALAILSDERARGADDHQIFSMVARQIRILIGARALLNKNPRVTKIEAASALDLHPFVASKALSQASNFTIEQLKRAHDFLFNLETKTKTGRVSADLSVDRVVMEFLR